MVSLKQYISQTNQINRLKNQRNDYNNKINQTKSDITKWTRLSNTAKENKITAYRNKEDKRKYLEDLNTKIVNAESEVKRLESIRDDLDDQIEGLNGIITQSEDDQLDMKRKTDDKMATLTSESIPNNTDKNIEYYNNMQMQNNILQGNIQELQNDYTTNDQKSLSTYKHTDYYGYIKTILFILYYLLIIIFLYLAYSRDYINKKLLIVLAFVIGTYPLYILKIEMYIYDSFMYLWALLRGTPYHKE